MVAAWAGTVGYAQTKVTNLDEYRTAMKAVAGGFGGSIKALQSGAVADAKTGLANAKANMESIHTFFVEKKKDDLAMLAQATVDKLDAAAKALDADPASAGAAVKAVGGTCGACHAKYRVQDPSTKAYSFKEGSL
jgi:cytochrome c556